MKLYTSPSISKWELCTGLDNGSIRERPQNSSDVFEQGYGFFFPSVFKIWVRKEQNISIFRGFVKNNFHRIRCLWLTSVDTKPCATPRYAAEAEQTVHTRCVAYRYRYRQVLKTENLQFRYRCAETYKFRQNRWTCWTRILTEVIRAKS